MIARAWVHVPAAQAVHIQLPVGKGPLSPCAQCTANAVLPTPPARSLDRLVDVVRQTGRTISARLLGRLTCALRIAGARL